ncbi:hypothetical protein APR04_001751 [Promicromonospora umidemergens]|uniref:DUF2742 domain-containing protein n=1 Tax=Promicromonospora umidemergens TaxID=629679 RepID=A0ABP8XEC3_9MICO|nr:hypothetical protein [Promicromonospora umidemergens]MCP2282848.1 hypothetical protein [Promicromonospora umidemergens]
MSGPNDVSGSGPTESDLPGSAPQAEPPATQDGAPDDPSQASLLRMLGWRPGDPLPDVDGLADALDEAGDDTDLSAPDSDHAQGLGNAALASTPDLLLPAEPEPVVPINWNTLDAERAEQEWWQLDAFVYWLRDDFGLTPQELPPLWHRHPELVWELSALRTSWLAAHAEDAHPGSPLMWLRDLGDSRRRLRDWVQRCGTTLTEDRPTRRTTWPGEQPAPSPVAVTVTDRATDFAIFVADDVARRRRIEADAQAEIEQARAERMSRLRRSWVLPTTGAEGPAPGAVAPDVTDEEDKS